MWKLAAKVRFFLCSNTSCHCAGTNRHVIDVKVLGIVGQKGVRSVMRSSKSNISVLCWLLPFLMLLCCLKNLQVWCSMHYSFLCKLSRIHWFTMHNWNIVLDCSWIYSCCDLTACKPSIINDLKGSQGVHQTICCRIELLMHFASTMMIYHSFNCTRFSVLFMRF